MFRWAWNFPPKIDCFLLPKNSMHLPLPLPHTTLLLTVVALKLKSSPGLATLAKLLPMHEQKTPKQGRPKPGLLAGHL